MSSVYHDVICFSGTSPNGADEIKTDTPRQLTTLELY